MSKPPAQKKKAPRVEGAARDRTPPAKPAAASRLRVQTRKLLAKHYRAKYGVR